MEAKPLKFIADAMLGRLAKWLRILGHDVVYDVSVSDNDLIARALDEQRVILTMDRELAGRKSAKNSLCIRSDDYKEQLREVVVRYNIDCTSRIFTRCLACNERLETVNKEKIRDKVPQYIYSVHDAFYICQHCDRVYWAGSHRNSILVKLKEILPGMK